MNTADLIINGMGGVLLALMVTGATVIINYAIHEVFDTWRNH